VGEATAGADGRGGTRRAQGSEALTAHGPDAGASRPSYSRLLDTLVFSSAWVALAAAALAAAGSQAMGIPIAPAAVGLAFCGTLVVYNVDRLRDYDRDRETTPARSDFVARHGAGLSLLTVAAGVSSVYFAVAAGATAVLVLAPILGLGLLHRRIKHLTFAKSAYITAAWVGVVVGVPAAIDPRATHVAWTGGIFALAIFANAMASNIRDREVAAARFGTAAVLGVARGLAAAGIAAGCLAPGAARALVAVPIATFLVLLPFRQEERYGLYAVDGALVVGALGSIAALRL